MGQCVLTGTTCNLKNYKGRAPLLCEESILAVCYGERSISLSLSPRDLFTGTGYFLLRVFACLFIPPNLLHVTLFPCIVQMELIVEDAWAMLEMLQACMMMLLL